MTINQDMAWKYSKINVTYGSYMYYDTIFGTYTYIYHCLSMYHRVESRFAPSQWETALLCNDVSHWLGASLESAMYNIVQVYCGISIMIHCFPSFKTLP